MGTKNIQLDREEKELPKLIRKKFVKIIARFYLETHEKAERIGLTFLIKICLAISSYEKKVKQCLDGVSGTLLLDNMELLKKS